MANNNLLVGKKNAGQNVIISEYSTDGRLAKAEDGRIFQVSNVIKAEQAGVVKMDDAHAVGAFEILKPIDDFTWERTDGSGITMINMKENDGIKGWN